MDTSGDLIIAVPDAPILAPWANRDRTTVHLNVPACSVPGAATGQQAIAKPSNIINLS
jgi:hypothetical protein